MAVIGGDGDRLRVELAKRGVVVVPGAAPAGDVVMLDALAPAGESADPLLLPELFPAIQAAARDGGGLLVAVADGDPRAAGLAGLLRSLNRERPGELTRLVVVPAGSTAPELATILLGELADRDANRPVVRRTRKHRYVRRLRPSPLETASEVKPARESVVLLIGGARGITALVARELAGRYGTRVALAGRTDITPCPDDELKGNDLPTLRAAIGAASPKAADSRARAVLARREVAKTLDAIRSNGGEAWYTPVDVTDPEAVAGLIKQTYARHGRLDGVVFAAGVNEDRLFADKTPDSFRRVFGTKVDGVRNLFAALEQLSAPPQFVSLFGSVAAVTGSRGQCDYAAANDAMAELGAAWARRTKSRCLTVHWGPWASERGSEGVALIDPAAGADALLRELAYGDPALTVVVQAAPNLT